MNTYKISFDVSGTISHIGADIAGIGVENVSEWVHSDTLFSAIIHAYAQKFGFKETEILINAFPKENEGTDNIPFRCSSVFLSNKKKLFVPKPKTVLPGDFDWSETFKVKFITLDNLYKWLGIEKMNWEDEGECQQLKQSILDDAKLYSKLFTKRVRAVNAKDRIHNQTQVFHRGETIYSKETEQYFFIDIKERCENDIKEAIQFMTDNAGLGGEINIGFSRMKSASWKPFTFPKPNGSDKTYLLSLFPVYKNIHWEDSWYDIINRKSWFNSPFFGTQLKKKAVKMISEGSCISLAAKTGKLIDVTPDKWVAKEGSNGWHSIYRNGIGYAIYY